LTSVSPLLSINEVILSVLLLAVHHNQQEVVNVCNGIAKKYQERTTSRRSTSAGLEAPQKPDDF
jgi:predicted Co/Zn/Cd cation transporter (cation efflux family)